MFSVNGKRHVVHFTLYLKTSMGYPVLHVNELAVSFSVSVSLNVITFNVHDLNSCTVNQENFVSTKFRICSFRVQVFSDTSGPSENLTTTTY